MLLAGADKVGTTMIYNFYQYTGTKQRHDNAFENGSSGLPFSAAPKDIKAETVHERVSKHVERVGEQRR